MRRFTLILTCFLLAPASIFAHEYDADWNRTGAKICQQLNTAVELYRKNDFKKARSEALMAYFKSYDSDIQPRIRSLLGSEPIVEREQQFQQFAQALSINHVDRHDQCDVQKQADDLCSRIFSDIKTLKKHNMKPMHND